MVTNRRSHRIPWKRTSPITRESKKMCLGRPAAARKLGETGCAKREVNEPRLRCRKWRAGPDSVRYHSSPETKPLQHPLPDAALALNSSFGRCRHKIREEIATLIKMHTRCHRNDDTFAVPRQTKKPGIQVNAARMVVLVHQESANIRNLENMEDRYCNDVKRIGPGGDGETRTHTI